MKPIQLSTVIKRLDPQKGSYHYLFVPGKVVASLPAQKKTRLICTLNQFSFPCGLNPLGEGNFFIILGKEKMDKSNTSLGQEVQFSLIESPHLLGIEVPEVLTVLLEQDPLAKAVYNGLTDGKKRSLIFSLQKTKNTDLQVQKILTFLAQR